MSGRPCLTAIYVHYHAAALLERSLEALRADVARAGLDLEPLIVDNGSNAAEASKLEALPARLHSTGGNIGFAAAVNRGVSLTSGDPVLLINPDARVRSGAVSSLVAALRRGAWIAGPRLLWTEDRKVFLPPAEERSRRAELGRVLGDRSPRWAAWARRRWRGQARRHWLATSAVASWDLSGGCLAFDRRAWRELGPFDESYRLYFEETDWLQRARARRILAVHEPAAEVVHDVGASSSKQGQAGAWFEQSAARFRRRHYGHLFAGFAEWAARRPRREAAARPAPFPSGGLTSPTTGLGSWIEMSPNVSGWPAAAEHVPAGSEQTWLPPEPLRAAAATSPWTVRRVDESGRELESWALQQAVAGEGGC